MNLTLAPVTNFATGFVDPMRDPQWDRLVLSHPKANIFHSAAWAKVLSYTYGQESHYVRCTRNGTLAALLPIMEVRSQLTGRRGVILPFSDFCDPLLFDDDNVSLLMDTLLSTARERKWKYIEMRGAALVGERSTPFARFYGHTMDLRNGANECFANFSSSVRRAIRKSERSGLSVELGQSLDAMLDFYGLHIRTRSRHGVPPQPRSYFINIHKQILEPGNGFVVIARLGRRPVASAVFFYFGKEAIFKFGASDERFLISRGNNLVMWEGIRNLAEQGFEKLHFGRTSPENHGLRNFKLGWGAQEEAIHYFRFEIASSNWMSKRDASGGFYTTFFRNLSPVLNRLAGTLIYPHLH